MIRLAEPRFSASTMIRVSMTQVFTPCVTDCTTKASEPRTESLNRTKISPLANS